MNDIVFGGFLLCFCITQLLCARWQGQARKKMDAIAQSNDARLWTRTSKDLKLIGNVFVVLLLVFYGLAFYWRYLDPSRREGYVFMAMVFGLVVGRFVWESWIYARLMRPQPPEYQQVARKMAWVSAIFNLTLIAFIYAIFGRAFQ